MPHAHCLQAANDCLTSAWRGVAALVFCLVAGWSPLAAQPAEAPGHLALHKWSGTLNVPDPVACAVDPQGRVYVTSTARRRVADIEIRQFPSWVANDLALTSVDEKAAFLKRALSAQDLSAPRGGLVDLNKDGLIDWTDLTVPSERIYQLRDTDGDGTADKITVFAEGFNTVVTGVAAGVLYHDGWVYATIAPDLWRFKDTDDDGVADIREILVHGFGLHIGYGGHDMHGLMLGPDGRIYWSIGDKAANVTSREGRHFYYPNEGSVLRIEPDGSNFEVYVRGVRNVQEPAFDDFGDLIGVDNDADMEGERERFVYLPEGSDSGWRINYQFMGLRSPWMKEGLWKPDFPGQPAHVLPPILNYSDGPGGFKRDPGTALGESLRGIFLLNEFPSGKMRGFRVERDGASFRMVDPDVYNEGIMGVGMSWHPDGSLMMVDWLEGYALKGAGAVWRVEAREGAENPLRADTHAMLRAGFGGVDEEQLIERLGHADQRVRIGAQMELAQRKRLPVLLEVAADANRTLLARVHAIWGYGQMLRRGEAAVDAAQALLTDADAEVRTQAARIIGDDARAMRSAGALIPLLADPSPRVRLQAAIALGKIKDPAAVKPLFEMAERDFGVPVLRHAVISGLTGCADASQLAEMKTADSVAVRHASVIALRRQASPLIAQFLDDADNEVIADVARGIYDDFSIPAALPALAARLDESLEEEMLARRVINANYRIGTKETAARLLTYALSPAVDRAMREEALTCLRLWPSPEPVDRVDGHARKFQMARIEDVLTPKLDLLLGLSDTGLKTIAIEIMIAHSLKASPAQIASIVQDAQAPGALRAQALRLMAGEPRTSPTFIQALDTSLAADAPEPLHRAALELLLPAAPERLVQEARTVLQTRNLAEQQHVLALLGKTGTSAADAILAEYGDQLVAGTCPAPLQLDVIEALRVRSGVNRSFETKLKMYETSSNAAAHGELVEGGSLELGREVVHNNLAANCLACHSITASGGSEVGPNLRLIGGSRDSAHLLESLLNPSAKIATGFGVVSVTLKAGGNVTGTLAQETADSITVRLFDGNRQIMPRSEIAEQTSAISVMPPMLGILQPREIRDAVAYLSSLKPQEKTAGAHSE